MKISKKDRNKMIKNKNSNLMMILDQSMMPMKILMLIRTKMMSNKSNKVVMSNKN